MFSLTNGEASAFAITQKCQYMGLTGKLPILTFASNAEMTRQQKPNSKKSQKCDISDGMVSHKFL